MSPSSLVLWLPTGVHYWEAPAEDQGREERGIGMFIPLSSLFSGPWFGSGYVPLPEVIASIRQPSMVTALSVTVTARCPRSSGILTVPSPQVLDPQ